MQEKQDKVVRGLVVSASKPSASRDDHGGQVKEKGKIEYAVRAAEAKDLWLEAWRRGRAFVCRVSPVVYHKTTGGSLVEPKAKSGGSAGRRQRRTGLTGGPV